ncbi:MAG: hypothetical protein Q8W44_11210 [Candidatus Palauibacterales bacterium]|nr:hypothetical protein [Candidatus Palauibacterales bacterium]
MSEREGGLAVPGGEDPGSLGAEVGSSVLAEAVDRIAHQLKNPLQAMTVNLEVIRMRAAEGDEEETERLTGVVDQNIRLVDRRIRMLIALARRSPEEPRTGVDLAEFLQEAAAAFRLDEREDGQGLRLRLPDADGEGDGLSVRAREGALLALVLAAASGARHAAREGNEPYLAAGSGEEPWVEVGPGGPWESGEQRDELAEQARRAGGEVETDTTGEGPFRVRFPRA